MTRRDLPGRERPGGGRLKCVRRVGVSAALAGLVGAALAGDVYVDQASIHGVQTGSDSRPHKTVERALTHDETSDGDTVHIKTGPYPEKLLINRKLTLVGWDGPAAIGGECEFCYGAIGSQCGSQASWEEVTARAILMPILSVFHPEMDLGNAVQWMITLWDSSCGPNNASTRTCFINAGSWAHDTCCFEHPDGNWCGPENMGGPYDYDRPCWLEWRYAMLRTSERLYWSRSIDPLEPDCDGVVDFSQYCAPAGTLVHDGDEHVIGRIPCCSGEWEDIDETEDAIRAMLKDQGIPEDTWRYVRQCR